MSDKKSSDNDPEKALMTLDQLSQTIEVMTNVVNRLKRHLTRQLSLTEELFDDEKKLLQKENDSYEKNSRELQQESFVVEITQQELENENGEEPILH